MILPLSEVLVLVSIEHTLSNMTTRLTYSRHLRRKQERVQVKLL
jgi:hypothetical protein